MFDSDAFLNRDDDFPLGMSHIDQVTGKSDIRKELRDTIDKCRPLIKSGELLLGLSYDEILNKTGACNKYFHEHLYNFKSSRMEKEIWNL